MDAIVVLQDEKGFTFREIAEWMSKNVAETDHNAIYREYNKHKKKELENHEREWGHIERHQRRQWKNSRRLNVSAKNSGQTFKEG